MHAVENVLIVGAGMCGMITVDAGYAERVLAADKRQNCCTSSGEKLERAIGTERERCIELINQDWN